MTTIAQMDCCTMLGIDPKTLRQWLRHATMQFAAHPTDARLKCLTQEQVQQLATLHGRPLPLTATVRPALPDVPPALVPLEQQIHPQLASEAQPLPTAHCGPVCVSEAADLMKRLAGLERSVTTMQEHLTYLALELLRERQRSSEQRLTALESLVQQTMVAPESPEWFDWLASLTSFRFVGPHGRFTAYRDSERGQRTRSWKAHRYFHGRSYKHYLGTTDHLTIASLEQMAAKLQACVDAL